MLETTGYQTALYDRDKREQIFLHSWPYKAKELRLIKMRGHFLGITKPHRALLEMQLTRTGKYYQKTRSCTNFRTRRMNFMKNISHEIEGS